MVLPYDGYVAKDESRTVQFTRAMQVSSPEITVYLTKLHRSNLEQTFVSAERINHYVQMKDVEPKTGQIPPSTWPSRGSIKFKSLSVRYAPDLPEVLHKISFDIQPGMRVGMVGSTGSGKSTLALCLFRAIEACEGSIEVDGLGEYAIQGFSPRADVGSR